MYELAIAPKRFLIGGCKGVFVIWNPVYCWSRPPSVHGWSERDRTNEVIYRTAQAKIAFMDTRGPFLEMCTR
jgi:hypothetical protein